MFNLQHALAMEGEADTAEEYFEALQHAINDGMWSLPGRNGREMMAAIEAGKCMLGRNQCRDYWGNTIPGRDDVQTGTKGSVAFVRARMGQEWADTMDAL